MNIEQIGHIQILRERVYLLDGECQNPSASAVVPPGAYPLYQNGEAKFWLMTGNLNVGLTKAGDGMFVSRQGDVASDLPVQFPSRFFGPKEWKELVQSIEATPKEERRLQIREEA